MKTYLKLSQEEVRIILQNLAQSQDRQERKIAEKFRKAFPFGYAPCDMELIGLDDEQLEASSESDL